MNCQARLSGLGEKWDRRFLDMARLASTWSKDPSTKCGAVIVRPDRSIVSTGYNGFPKGCSDDPALYADRPTKLERVVHAEENAILQAKCDVSGFIMYTWPPGPGPSCARCTSSIINAGITCVVHGHPSNANGFNERWMESIQHGLDMYEQAGVVVISYPV